MKLLLTTGDDTLPGRSDINRLKHQIEEMTMNINEITVVLNALTATVNKIFAEVSALKQNADDAQVVPVEVENALNALQTAIADVDAINADTTQA